MKQFHCMATLPGWHLDNGRVSADGLAKLILAATSIEDEGGPICCQVHEVARMRDREVCDGDFAVHLEASVSNGTDRGFLRSVIDGNSGLVAGALDELHDQAPQLVTEAWADAVLRDMRLCHDQTVESVQEGQGRYQVYINGLRAGIVCGSGPRWTAEWSRGHLGRTASRRSATLLIQQAWGFPKYRAERI
jgi:hypothetical protein